jgi:hypothetical protein
MADGCLVVVMDDDVPIHRMVQKILRPSDVVAPWHVRSPGGSTPCNYLFIRPEPPLTEADESFVKWNTTAQAELLRRIASAPPAEHELNGQGERTVKKAFRVPDLLGADRLVLIDGGSEVQNIHGSPILVVELPAELNVGDRFDVDVQVAPRVAPTTVSAEQLVAMAMEVASAEPQTGSALQGTLALDPYQTHAIVRSRGPRALARTLASLLPCSPTHPIGNACRSRYS